MTTTSVDRTGMLATLVLAVLLVGLFVITVGLPGLRATQRTEAFGQAVAILAATDASLASLAEEIEELEGALAEAENLLPVGIGVDEFVDRVGEAAGGSDVRVESVIPGEVTDDARYRMLELELRAVGEYAALHRFFGAVEEMPQLTRVRRVKIAVTGERCTAHITLVLYYAQDGDH